MYLPCKYLDSGLCEGEWSFPQRGRLEVVAENIIPESWMIELNSLPLLYKIGRMMMENAIKEVVLIERKVI